MRWWMFPLLTTAAVALVVSAWFVRQVRRGPAAGARVAADLRVPTLAPKGRHLVLLMIDGLPLEPFAAALAGHELPHLERLFARGPVIRAQAISTVPSATAPSLPELLSGRWAAAQDSSAPNAVHAFDRDERRIVRYLTEPDTWAWPVGNLFDAATRAGLSAVTVFEGRWEGPESILTTAAVARAAALEVIGDTEASGDASPVDAFLRRIRERGVPDLSLVVFNDVDLKGHFHGPASAEVRRALVATDAHIGRIAEALRKARTPSGGSVLDETTFILFGDHGMVASGRFLDLTAFLATRGLTAFDAATLTHVVFRERLGEAWTRWPDAILVSGGSNITQVYLRRPSGGWRDGGDATPGEATHRHPDVWALARSLADLPGVGQVLRQVEGGAIEVRAARGVIAHIVERGTDGRREWAYTVPAGARDDPFGYLGAPAAASVVSRSGSPVFYDADTWMQRTVALRYPGVVPLIPKAFHLERFTGDLMVTALPGWSFLRNQRGDHGNLERDAMLTPLVLFGAGVTSATSATTVRLVDIFPTAAVLLGASPDDAALGGLDGRVLPGVQPPA